ncbi:MAG: flagellar hook-basal body complex protein FliE [Firmicutes bacterium]|nr:flagellar hook-basal body complex protein FliE [Bacillota bacterium]
MKITPILPLQAIQGEKKVQDTVNFGEILKEMLAQVNRMQLEADQATIQLARGDDIDLHKVMILGTRANLALETTMAIRNKLLDAYQEIMRMQV